MSKKHTSDYGTPVSGSKTEARGKKAHQKISGEIVELCAIIEDQGSKCLKITKKVSFFSRQKPPNKNLELLTIFQFSRQKSIDSIQNQQFLWSK